MKKLSIVTINFNDAQGLEKTIKSVISQTFEDFEYIVIDGNSTDGSKKILQKYKCKLDIAISEPDTGIYNAMNKGASFASGEYLLFLNSGDNLYKTTSLQELFDTNPKEDIVSCICIEYNEKNRYKKIPPKEISLFSFINSSLPHPSTLIRSSIFSKVGGYHEKYRIISDWCFFIEALIIHNASYCTREIELSEFNCFGISSTTQILERDLCTQFLNDKFNRIIIDYPSIKYEALFNVAYWITSLQGKKLKISLLPFKIINHILDFSRFDLTD